MTKIPKTTINMLINNKKLSKMIMKRLILRHFCKKK